MKKPETICYTLTHWAFARRKCQKRNPTQNDINSIGFEIKLKICVL